MPIFVSKLDAFTYKSLLTAARLPKLSEMLQWYIAFLPTSFQHCDLIDEVMRGHQRSQNQTFAYKSLLPVAWLPKVSEMLRWYISLLPASFWHYDLIDERSREVKGRGIGLFINHYSLYEGFPQFQICCNSILLCFLHPFGTMTSLTRSREVIKGHEIGLLLINYNSLQLGFPKIQKCCNSILLCFLHLFGTMTLLTRS